ncbi:focadhesin [Arapaima gigas]
MLSVVCLHKRPSYTGNLLEVPTLTLLPPPPPQLSPHLQCPPEMSDTWKKRFEFPNPLIQAQAVKSLVTAVLREKANNELLQLSTQSPALEALWEQCGGQEAAVRSACCDALVLLVEQGHADLQQVFNSVLNLIPSARCVQGLLRVLGKLMRMQAKQRQQQDGDSFTSPYSIRNPPHPYITVLENRPDCWPTLLLEINDFIQQAAGSEELAHVTLLVPFLRYLYCEPLRLPEHAMLRQSLLKVLLPPSGPGTDSAGGDNRSPTMTRCLVHSLLELVPHMQVDSMTAMVELGQFLEAVLPALLSPRGSWGPERAQLVLQLLCACHLSLGVTGECGTPLRLIQQLLPGCSQGFPTEQMIVGLALLLMKAPALQQTAILTLGTAQVPGDEETCPQIAPILVLPLLQILSCSVMMEALTESGTRVRNQQLARPLLEAVQRRPWNTPEDAVRLSLPLSSWYNEVLVATLVLRRLSCDPAAACDWLHAACSSLPLNQRVPDHFVLLLGHVVTTSHGNECRLALDTTALVAQADPSQVPGLLLVLMQKLSRLHDPALTHAVLYTLPKLGTHKFCVPQVLQTLQMLASSPKLQAVTLRLMSTLWQKQDRVYPELQRLMAQLEKTSTVVLGKEDQWEHILARAACVREVCRDRPYQHGGDMLAEIADNLAQCTATDQATPAALALQALRELCQAEVVDICSTWAALGPRLTCDSRPLVLMALAELLALVPKLSVKTEEYEKFKDEVLTILWRLALSQEPEVANAGYRALCEFPEAAHTVLHLPEPARPPPKVPDDNEEETEGEKEEDLSVPGSSYIKLLLLTPTAVLPALEDFLTSLVRQEMTQMPRGVYHTALRGSALRSDQGKTVSGIPGFMLKTYEKNKQPGLKPGLAAGLLLCYELPVQSDRDGRPIGRFLMSRGRSYQQTLAALIHEVNIQPSEWHRSILLPQAWRGFMGRAFYAVLQGRRAELEMLQKKGKGSPEELQFQQHHAWLWARDQLTDVVKSAAKDSPVVQGNSILALSGLAVALAKYESGLPVDPDGAGEVGTEFLSSRLWMAMVMDTLLSVVSSSYQPKGRVFPWFQHRSYSGENTASAIARSCASLGLSLLAPVLLSSHSDATWEVLAVLEPGLPGGPAADESQAVQFHTGLAVGLFLCCLHGESDGNVFGQKMNELLMSSLDRLEACCFDTNLEYNTGCILGLGLVLSSLSSSNRPEQRVRVAQSLERLLQELEDSGSRGRMLQEVRLLPLLPPPTCSHLQTRCNVSVSLQVLVYAAACVGVSAFSSGVISASKAEEITNTLRYMTEESQQTPGFALALGLLVHGLSTCGHGKAEDLHGRLLGAWIKILLAEGCPTMQRLAAVNGLVALAGSENFQVQLKSESEQSQQHSRLNEVIRSITQVITCSSAIGLQSNASCLLGHLYLAQVSTSHSRAAGELLWPSDRQAPDGQDQNDGLSCSSGPEFTHPVLVKVALGALATVGTSFQYPPVNWGALLSPLMRLNFGKEVQHQCVKLAASQCQSSQSACLFLGMWLSPPLVHSLSLRTRARLYRSLPTWMKHVAADKLQTYVEVLGVQQFGPESRLQRLDLCLAVLEGLSQAMALPDPSQNTWDVLRAATEGIFALLPNHIQDGQIDLYVGIAKCLSEMGDTEIDRITSVTEDNLEKTGFVLAYLSSQGRVPLLGLNDIIATAVKGSQQEEIIWILTQSFYQSRLASNPNTGVLKRMEWLLELMGHLRNVAYGTTPVKCGDPKQATDFLLRVFCAAILTWADHSMPLLQGVGARWFPWKENLESPGDPGVLYRPHLTPERPPTLDLLALPHSVQQLLGKEPWKGQTQKFIDWLFGMAEAPTERSSENATLAAKATLMSLRHLPEFRKKGVWTRAYGW